ncbi:right-handed parallel beta-helix repeat-containing protein [Cohnella zeiphila]|uniref:Right-handed parallel beta-helix repeat-containing protein n=1 Tax=Cohnella zeiphila TaxID=2761120 RepID=A0A7X0VVS0_9BACL|nr:right-handed parallel beta-helix repeat-containing protein [Cohnella zeiphila]MBB6732201.1 right-handed parallel beta-helix repeat-containing protein [Cohnella zeiphila]
MRIEMAEFGLRGGEERVDATLAVVRALDACRNSRERTELIFAEGRYDFHPERATEFAPSITNHDQGGTRKTGFPLTCLRDFVLDGQGAEFVFHGPMIPFWLERSSDISLRNFTVDWDRPMFEQGIVTEATDTSFDFRLPPDVPYEMRDDGLYFEFGGRRLPVWGLHDIDPVRKTHAYGSGDRLSWSSFRKLKLQEIEPGLIRVTGELRHLPEPGHAITMRFGRRENPGFFVNGCANVAVENVTLHHAPGMGLVAQRTAGLTLRKFDVKLKPGSGRLVTATADAVHFTNCRGTIRIEDCLFENQLDDPCNVHGVYVRIVEKVADDKLLVRFEHEMTVGLEFAGPGDALKFVSRDSLLPYASATVRSWLPVNAELALISFDGPVPEEIGERDVLENETWNPDLLVRGCTVRANRARGFLITTPGKVLLEGNTISAPGAGIKLSGDANSWFESGAVRDVTIRGNTFRDCNYCWPDWGRAVIDIDPEIEEPERHPAAYHRNIRIEDNDFITYAPALVYGHSVDGLTFRGNRIRESGSYPTREGQETAIELRAVTEADFSGNRFERAGQSALLNGEEVPL